MRNSNTDLEKQKKSENFFLKFEQVTCYDIYFFKPCLKFCFRHLRRKIINKFSTKSHGIFKTNGTRSVEACLKYSPKYEDVFFQKAKDFGII